MFNSYTLYKGVYYYYLFLLFYYACCILYRYCIYTVVEIVEAV